jgi:hypothetical protein
MVKLVCSNDWSRSKFVILLKINECGRGICKSEIVISESSLK